MSLAWDGYASDRDVPGYWGDADEFAEDPANVAPKAEVTTEGFDDAECRF